MEKSRVTDLIYLRKNIKVNRPKRGLLYEYEGIFYTSDVKKKSEENEKKRAMDWETIYGSQRESAGSGSDFIRTG